MLEQLSARSRDAKHYLFEGDLVVQGQKGSAPGRLLSSAKVKLAVSQPGRYLLNIKVSKRTNICSFPTGERTGPTFPA